MNFINIFRSDEEIMEECTTKAYPSLIKRYDITAAEGRPMPTLVEIIAFEMHSRDRRIAEIKKAIEMYGDAYNDVAVKAASDPDFYLQGIAHQIEIARENAGIKLLRGRRRDVEAHNAPILALESYIHALAKRCMDNAEKKFNDIADIMDGVTEYRSIDE